MKAAVYYGPGDVRVVDVPEPNRPGPEEVILRVLAGSLCGTDVSQFQKASMVPIDIPHSVSGHVGPMVIGHEITGEVVACGRLVENLKVGDRVTPGCGWWCEVCPQCLEGRYNICQHYYVFGLHAPGGFAEYATFPAKMCIKVPEPCPPIAAAIAQPCAVGFHALSRAFKHCELSSSQKIALYGVGGIGSLLLAILKHTSTAQVIAVDVDQTKLSLASKLGAAYQINAKTSDPVAVIDGLTSGQGVDIAIDTSAVPLVIGQALASVSRGGLLLQVGIPGSSVGLFLDQAVVYEKTILTTNGMCCPTDLPKALDLLATTNVADMIIDRVIPLSALVSEGLVPLAQGKIQGKVVVSLV